MVIEAGSVVDVSSIDVILEAVERGAAVKLQDRTVVGLRTILLALQRGQTVNDAAAVAGVQETTVKRWRSAFPAFGDAVAKLVEQNQTDRQAARAEERWARLNEEGMILRYDDPVPEVPPLIDWRLDYFGRPTPLHQQAAVMALDDLTNLYVFIFGPTGMGKDTLIGDYASRRVCPDRTGLRVAWIMKIKDKAERRLARMGRYLTDAASIREAPERTPGGAVPKRSLIEDYGPFRWEPGMMWEDGGEVTRPAWRAGAMWFVRSMTPEADPNWQALGVEGALQGDRVDEAVCSDIFDLENQKSPTVRGDQLRWVNGILHSRLDSRGRLVMIGNWLPIENNYEVILDSYLEGATLLREVTIGPATYRKYANGVATVFIKAIYEDPETGEELSYWPERFPLEDHLISPDGTETVTIAGLTNEEHLEYADAGWVMERGLYSTRAKDPVMFKAMYQQERDPDVGIIDFTDEVFEEAWDHERSFGYLRPHEIRLLGIDPAQRYGAAWLLLACDRELEELTVADFWWGEKLGVAGIKDRLLLQPLGRYAPSWVCYEGNKDGAVLADPMIQRAIQAAGASIAVTTVGQERSSAVFGPGALATTMRNRKLRIPYATAEDKAKAEQLKSHLRAFDVNPDRSKPGQSGHRPDDLTFALYSAWRKGITMIERDDRDTGINFGVPAAIRRAMDRRREQYRSARGKDLAKPREVLHRGNPLELLEELVGEYDD